MIVERLNIWTREPVLSRWETIVQQVRDSNERVTIGIVGKYVDHTDAQESTRPCSMADS